MQEAAAHDPLGIAFSRKSACVLIYKALFVRSDDRNMSAY